MGKVALFLTSILTMTLVAVQARTLTAKQWKRLMRGFIYATVALSLFYLAKQFS